MHKFERKRAFVRIEANFRIIQRAPNTTLLTYL